MASVEEYIKQNIDPDILAQAEEFKNSEAYKRIEAHTSSAKYQEAKKQLLERDEIVHKTILSDIQKLQDSILSN